VHFPSDAAPEQQFAALPKGKLPVATQQIPAELAVPEQQLPAVPLSGDRFATHEHWPTPSVVPGQQFAAFPSSLACAMHPQRPPVLTAPEQQSPVTPLLRVP